MWTRLAPLALALLSCHRGPAPSATPPPPTVAVPRAPAPTIDGQVADAEWARATAIPLGSGATLRLMHDGATLYLAISGLDPVAGAGFGCMFVADPGQVAIFHASARLGSAIYAPAPSGLYQPRSRQYVWRDPDVLRRDEGWTGTTVRPGAPPQQELAITFERLGLPDRPRPLALGYFVNPPRRPRSGRGARAGLAVRPRRRRREGRGARRLQSGRPALRPGALDDRAPALTDPARPQRPISRSAGGAAAFPRVTIDKSATLEAPLAETGWLRRLARSLVHEAAAADDLVQDTYLAAARRPPGDAPLRPWLVRVTTYLSRMRFRGEARRATRERAVAALASGPASPQELVERLELQRVLAGLVLALPALDRDIVLLTARRGSRRRQPAGRRRRGPHRRTHGCPAFRTRSTGRRRTRGPAAMTASRRM